MSRILITGSAGLVGRALRDRLGALGHDVAGLDLRADGDERGDVRDLDRVRRATAHVDGIVHLAAISRVVWGEQDPDGCVATNVGGLRNIIAGARAAASPPWLVFASSREVYGEADAVPVSEDAPLRPMNVYGRSKVEGESLIREAAHAGLRAATVRLSNVYGSAADHADRVIPAFTRAAVKGEPLRIDGADHTFDFTHVDDTTRGLAALVDRLDRGAPALPPIHLVTGRPTTLSALAALTLELSGSVAPTALAPPRHFDVSRFFGSPERALRLLGWTPLVSLREGLARLIADLRRSPP